MRTTPIVNHSTFGKCCSGQYAGPIQLVLGRVAFAMALFFLFTGSTAYIVHEARATYSSSLQPLSHSSELIRSIFSYYQLDLEIVMSNSFDITKNSETSNQAVPASLRSPKEQFDVSDKECGTSEEDGPGSKRNDQNDMQRMGKRQELIVSWE